MNRVQVSDAPAPVVQTPTTTQTVDVPPQVVEPVKSVQTTEPKPEPPKVIPTTTKHDKDSIAELYQKYKSIGQEEDGHQDNNITVSGLMALAADLGVDAEDVVMLVLLYKIGSTKQYVVSESEWTQGWSKLGCTNLSQIKSKLPGFVRFFEFS